MINVKLIENDLDENYVRVTYDDGEERVTTVSPAEALIVTILIAMGEELDELKKKIK